ncbi:Alpha/beta hydrolase [Balamuthia mandrillaris]
MKVAAWHYSVAVVVASLFCLLVALLLSPSSSPAIPSSRSSSWRHASEQGEREEEAEEDAWRGSFLGATALGPVEYAVLPGSGPPILFLHGSPGGIDQCKVLVEGLFPARLVLNGSSAAAAAAAAIIDMDDAAAVKLLAHVPPTTWRKELHSSYSLEQQQQVQGILGLRPQQHRQEEQESSSFYVMGYPYTFICVSRPGYLRTPLDTRTNNASRQADLFAALLDELEVDSVAVMGISGGKHVALEFASRHPHRCWATILLEDSLSSSLSLASSTSSASPSFAEEHWLANAHHSSLLASFFVSTRGSGTSSPFFPSSPSLYALQMLQTAVHTSVTPRLAGFQNDQSTTMIASAAATSLKNVTVPLLRIGCSSYPFCTATTVTTTTTTRARTTSSLEDFLAASSDFVVW